MTQKDLHMWVCFCSNVVNFTPMVECDTAPVLHSFILVFPRLDQCTDPSRRAAGSDFRFSAHSLGPGHLTRGWNDTRDGLSWYGVKWALNPQLYILPSLRKSWQTCKLTLAHKTDKLGDGVSSSSSIVHFKFRSDQRENSSAMANPGVTNEESPNQTDDIPIDYTVPDVSVWKATHLWKASFCVVGLCLFCQSSKAPI